MDVKPWCARLVTLIVASTVTMACGGSSSPTNPIAATPTSASGAGVTSVLVEVPRATVTAATAMFATATANYSDGTTADITSHTSTTWSSSATAVATVSTSGRVVGVSAGTTTISAQHGGYTGSVAVTVTTTTSVVTLAVRADDFTLKVGETTTVTAKAEYLDSSLDHMVTPTWSSSAPGVASVTADGVVTALAVGTTDIWGTYEGKRDEARIEVSSSPRVTSITASAGRSEPPFLTDMEMSLSDTVHGIIYTRAYYSDGTSKSVEAVYGSDDELVVWVGAAVLDSSGVYWNRVWPEGVGKATVTAIYQGHSATVTYTITP